MFGGIKAIIATDILQVILIVVVFLGVVFLVIPRQEIFSLGELTFPKGSDYSFNSQGFLSVLMLPALFSLIEQDLAQRFFAARNQKVATLSALFAAVILLTFASIPMLLGIYAKSVGIIPVDGQSPLVLLLQSKLSSFGMTVVACALLAAICSTADSLLGAASSNLIADFANKNSKRAVLNSQLITFLVGSLALVIAFYFDSVIALLVKSYSLSISALFVPLLIAMFSKNPSKTGAQFSVSSGFVIFILCEFLDLKDTSVFIALFFSAIAYYAGSFYQKNK